MSAKEIYSITAIILTFVGFYPYITSILRGKTKPHVFSWVIWGVTTTVVYAAQVADHGGVGAWPTGISGLITFYVAWLAYKHKSDTHISRSDWGFFITALLSIPLWYITSSPLWSVIILTSIDGIGFIPTYRKAFILPHEEQITFYGLFTFRNIFSILALENFSITTLLFPVVTAIGCIPLMFMIYWRRKLAEI